jgi:hypothetical protein
MSCLVQRHIGVRRMRGIAMVLCAGLVMGAVYTAIVSTCLGRRERRRK